MNIVTSNYGTLPDGDANLYTLDNGKGLSAQVTDYGATLVRLVYNGCDVVLGWDSLEAYASNSGYFGATVGRNSNRIANSRFELNGKEYKLFANDGKDNLHGGKKGFDKKIWDAVVSDSECAVSFSCTSPDGEEGFPGNVDVKVTYTLTDQNGIVIRYEATSDADTVINMTNHSYFNLNGHQSGSILNHTLRMNSRFFTPNAADCVPDGRILSVDGTAFDFTRETTFADNLAVEDEQIKLFGCYDHNFVLDGRGLRLCAEAKGDKSGIVMEMYTDMPGVQIYVPTTLCRQVGIKDGAEYPAFNAFCLETQYFPNNINYSHFPSSVLKKGEKYDSVTEYRFR